jgi:cell division protein FtsL
MKRPQYELIPLRLAITQCQTNINAFQQAVINEQTKISELEGYIKEWEDYNKTQDVAQEGLAGNGNYIRQDQ